MAKISPVSIKYMIHANFRVEGALEKPDVIGAIFGQTEGLLGSDLEMRELQKEGKIGRIEVELERKDKITTGLIKVPTALDQSETTLIAAAIETIEKMGPCDAQIEVENIEDVRGSKRDYIIERAKKLMADISKTTDSREISKTIKESARVSDVKEYGDEKLPYGDLSDRELIVVEGRADVLNLLRAGIKNVIAMNGTKLPEAVKKLSQEKEVTLFVDGDRGGKLISQNVVDNARVKYLASAPDGKEVEELTGKEILMSLRKRVPASESGGRSFRSPGTWKDKETIKEENLPKRGQVKEKLDSSLKEKLKEISEKNKGTGKVIFLDKSLNGIKRVSVKTAAATIRKLRSKPVFISVDGTATGAIINAAEDVGVIAIAAKNFSTNAEEIELVSF